MQLHVTRDEPIDLDSRRRVAVESSWRQALRSARVHIGRDRMSVAAGAFAYRWFLSLFPAMIALLGVSSLLRFPHSVTVRLIHGITHALPSGAADVLTTALEHATSSQRTSVLTVVVAGAVGLWSGTSGMVMVEEGLDMAYEITRDRSFLAKRLRALPLLAAAVVLGGGASALVVFGGAIGSALVHSAPVGGAELRIGWTVVRWIAALVLIGLLFTVLYCLGPNRAKARWQWLSPGAVVGMVLWALISLGFSVYTSASGSFTSTYGAFAGVAILIFWLYLTGVAILVGGEINAAFERQTHPDPF